MILGLGAPVGTVVYLVKVLPRVRLQMSARQAVFVLCIARFLPHFAGLVCCRWLDRCWTWLAADRLGTRLGLGRTSIRL